MWCVCCDGEKIDVSSSRTLMLTRDWPREIEKVVIQKLWPMNVNWRS